MIDPKMSSFFSPPSTAPSSLKLAKTEISLYTSLFSLLSSSCHSSCRSSSTPDLEIGEQVCVDRCVRKFMEAQGRVGVVMREFEEGERKNAEGINRAE